MPFLCSREEEERAERERDRGERDRGDTEKRRRSRSQDRDGNRDRERERRYSAVLTAVDVVFDRSIFETFLFGVIFWFAFSFL